MTTAGRPTAPRPWWQQPLKKSIGAAAKRLPDPTLLRFLGVTVDHGAAQNALLAQLAANLPLRPFAETHVVNLLQSLYIHDGSYRISLYVL